MLFPAAAKSDEIPPQRWAFLGVGVREGSACCLLSQVIFCLRLSTPRCLSTSRSAAARAPGFPSFRSLVSCFPELGPSWPGLCFASGSCLVTGTSPDCFPRKSSALRFQAVDVLRTAFVRHKAGTATRLCAGLWAAPATGAGVEQGEIVLVTWSAGILFSVSNLVCGSSCVPFL